jgi:hypothetical protein
LSILRRRNLEPADLVARVLVEPDVAVCPDHDVITPALGVGIGYRSVICPSSVMRTISSLLV